MNAGRTLVLAAVVAVTLGGALWLTQSRRPVQQETVQQPAVAGLEKGLNDVTQVRVVGADSKVLATLVRGDDGWTMPEKGGYAVDVALVKAYLLKLAQAKRVEAKTSTPALYERLGVEDVAAKEAAGVQLEIDGLSQPVKLIVGHNVQRGSGTYVRDAGVAQSWQVNADLAVERTAANWLQRDLVDIAAGRVAKVSVKPATGEPITIVRSTGSGTGNEFTLAALPRGREAASEFVADATAGLLAGLRFDDVFPVAEKPAPVDGLRRSEFVTEDGVVLDVSSWQVGEQTFARFAARVDETTAAAQVERAQAQAVREHAAASTAPPAATPSVVTEGASPASIAPATPAVPAPASAPPLAATDPAADREQRLAAVHDEVARLNARFSPWTFVLPPFKATNLNKSLEDYLKPKA
jgi:hypothetical protein